MYLPEFSVPTVHVESLPDTEIYMALYDGTCTRKPFRLFDELSRTDYI